MKKIFTAIMMIVAFTMGANAQVNNKMHRQGGNTNVVQLEQQAKRMAQQLNLDEAATKKFVPLYEAYKNDRKRALLEVDDAYTQKFGKVLSEQQYSQMKQLEYKHKAHSGRYAMHKQRAMRKNHNMHRQGNMYQHNMHQRNMHQHRLDNAEKQAS